MNAINLPANAGDVLIQTLRGLLQTYSPKAVFAALSCALDEEASRIDSYFPRNASVRAFESLSESVGAIANQKRVEHLTCWPKPPVKATQS